MNIIDKFVKWYLEQKQKEKKVTQKKIEDEKLQEAIKQLKALYDFVKFLNEKAFKNRHERKNFWRSVADGQNLMESAVLSVLERYGVKPESIEELKRRKEEKIKQEEKKTCPPDCSADCNICANKPQPSEAKKNEK